MAMTLKQFAKYAERDLPPKYAKVLNQIQRVVALDIYADILHRSPVDTGRYRGNWSVAVNSPPRWVIEEVDGQQPPKKPGEPARTRRPANRKEKGAASGVIAQAQKPSDVIWLSNNLPYAEVLERGRIGNRGSVQAPEGVAQVAITSVLGKQKPPVVVFDG